MYASKIYSKKFILPAFLIFFILFLLPSFMGFYYSLTNWNSMSEEIKFIGIYNFKEIVNDGSSLIFIKNTLLYAFFTTLLKVLFGLGLALMLNEGIKTKNVIRTIYFMPIIISNLIVGLMFQQVFHPTNGILNVFFRTIGLGFMENAWILSLIILIPIFMILLNSVKTVTESATKSLKIRQRCIWTITWRY